MTFCKNCRHMISLESDTPRADAWYNHLCGATPLPLITDAETGKAVHSRQNDLGMWIVSENPYEYCRNVNTGHCPKYEPITWPVAENADAQEQIQRQHTPRNSH